MANYKVTSEIHAESNDPTVDSGENSEYFFS